MNSQDFRSLQEAYIEVYSELDEAAVRVAPKVKGAKDPEAYMAGRSDAGKRISGDAETGSRHYTLGRARGARPDAPTQPGQKPVGTPKLAKWEKDDIQYRKANLKAGKVHKVGGPKGLPEETDLFDCILEYLLDEGYADTNDSAIAIMANMSEEWREDIMEKEDSEYEKASDAALDSRYGYGRASGDKRSFGRAANRSSAAAALRAIRRGKRSGSGTSTEAGADAVHQGWAKTAKTSSDQTPEKKARRAGLANTPYSKLPDDEKEKDRVSFNAVKATYNNRNR
jgi:hypothetical protein